MDETRQLAERHGTGWRGGRGAAGLRKIVAALALLATGTATASAQQAEQPAASIPGLSVSLPSGPAPGGPPPGQVNVMPGTFAPQPGMPPQAPAAKPKPKPKPKRAASAAKASHKAAPAIPALSAEAAAGTRIVALVNDEPITGFEVEQRQRFLALSANLGPKAQAIMKGLAQDPKTNQRLKAILDETIKANPGKSRDQVIAAFEERKKAFVQGLQKQAVEGARASVLPTVKKEALEELIQERLKFQEAKKKSVTIPDADVNKVFESMAQRNKMTGAEFKDYIARQGSDAGVILSRVKASLAWREVVKKRYGAFISVSPLDIEKLAAKAGGEEAQEFQLKRITLGAPGGAIDQRAMATQLAEANAIRSAFKGCATMAGLVKGRAEARYEDLGFRKANVATDPVRSLLPSARDGDVLPPNLNAGSVEIYAVCGRRTVKIDEEKRQAAENELTMQEFEKLAQRYLADLRRDSLVEIR